MMYRERYVYSDGIFYNYIVQEMNRYENVMIFFWKNDTRKIEVIQEHVSNTYRWWFMNMCTWCDEEMCEDSSFDQETERHMIQNENDIYLNLVEN